MNRLYGLLTLVYCGVIFAFSSVETPPDVLRWITAHDLAAHAVLYAGLGWCAAMTYRKGAVRRRGWKLWAVPVAFVALYGGSDELHQLFVPGRHCALADWIADVVGGTVVQTVFLLGRSWHGRVEDGV